MKTRAFLFVSCFTMSALAQEPLAPLPPPEKAPTDKPGDKHDVTIEYVPGPGQPPETVIRPTPASDAPAPPPPKPFDEATRPRLALRAEGGFQYAQFSGVPVTAGRGRFGIGMQNDRFANYVTGTFMVGSTENGLRTWDVRFGWQGEWIPVRVLRVGLDGEIGYLFMHRATMDERMWALGVGAGAHVGVDLVSWGPHDDHAITLQGRFDVGLSFGGLVMWGPAALAGIRY